MHDSTPPQIKHMLAHPPVAGASALPASDVRQGVFHGYPLAQLRTPLRRLLAFAQLLQQGFIGMNGDTTARDAGCAALPQGTARTCGRWKLHDLPRHKGHDLAARTLQCVSLPIPLEGTFRKIRPLLHWPGLAENG